MRKYKKLFTNEFFLSFISIVCFVLLLLNSCSNNALQAKTQLQLNAPATKSENLNTALAQKTPELQKAHSSADYKIGPEDLLEIDTFQVQELKSSVRVSAQGFIKIPLLDKVQAGGLTVSELEAAIAKKLEKFVKEPVVSVFVKEYRSQQIAVLGSVKSPQVYYATGQKYLLDMLSLAGGLAPDAGSYCIIQRTVRTGDQESNEKIVIDLDELLINGRVDLNVPVMGGDFLQVPRSAIFFVDGAVRAPGEYPLKGKNTTFTQAISLAHGIDASTGKYSDIKIYRDNGSKEREVITLDYDDVLTGKSPDVLIREKDIIIVGSSALKRFLNTISGGFSAGMFSLGKSGAF